VNSTLDLATVLSTIVAKAAELSDTEAGSIYVVDPTTQGLQLRASHGMSEELIAELNRQGVDLSEKTIAEAAAQKAPVQTPDLKDAAPSPVLNILLRAGYRAVLIVPLLGPEGLIGVLVVRRKALSAARAQCVGANSEHHHEKYRYSMTERIRNIMSIARDYSRASQSF
jgi:GAF domain-containing protein